MTTSPDNDASVAAPDAAAQHSADSLTDKQQMVEKLFRHTNKFLEENKHDPLLVVESLAAILVRYAALFGPVEQMAERLGVIEQLVAQESGAIQHLALAPASAAAAPAPG